MICLKTEPAELQGDWKPRQREEHKLQGQMPSRALRTAQPGGAGRRTMGQATRNPETQERTVGAGLWNSAANVRWRPYLLLDKDDKHRVSLISILAFCPLGGGKGPCCRGKADSPPPNTAFPCGHIGSYFSPHALQ